MTSCSHCVNTQDKIIQPINQHSDNLWCQDNCIHYLHTILNSFRRIHKHVCVCVCLFTNDSYSGCPSKGSLQKNKMDGYFHTSCTPPPLPLKCWKFLEKAQKRKKHPFLHTFKKGFCPDPPVSVRMKRKQTCIRDPY